MNDSIFLELEDYNVNKDNIRIAYTPYYKDLSGPGDRRRFVFYANERKLEFEIANPNKIYDVIYLTYGCNLGIWIKYKSKYPDVKFIFELIDSYLLESTSILTTFRGITKFIMGKESRLWWNYKSALRKIISLSDAIVCSTNAQKNNMLSLNNNIHLSLDYFTNDLLNHKISFNKNKISKLVWEGQSFTVVNLLMLNNVFEKLGENYELLIITDKVINSQLRFLNKKTISLLNKLKINYKLIEWNRNSFSKHIADADLAIIPISPDNPMMWNKPENKLLLFWEIGIPVLTSETPAYKNVMEQAGLDYYCSNSDEWLEKILFHINSSIKYKESVSVKAKDYLIKFHNKDKILKTWDAIFDSVFMEIEKK